MGRIGILFVKYQLVCLSHTFIYRSAFAAKQYTEETAGEKCKRQQSDPANDSPHFLRVLGFDYCNHVKKEFLVLSPPVVLCSKTVFPKIYEDIIFRFVLIVKILSCYLH